MKLTQEQLEAEFEEADKVIKKVWDETETHYNEEPVESMRDNAREWGVIYRSIGGPTRIKGKVTLADGTVKPNEDIFFVEGDQELVTDESGEFEFETTIVDDAVIKVSGSDIVSQDVPFTIVEGVAMNLNITVVPKAP